MKPLILCIMLTLSAITATAADMWKGQVISVTDGDTITVMHSDSQEKLRLCGIDAPEKGQPFYQDACRFVSDLLNLQTVEVRTAKDGRYGTKIAWVYYRDESGNRKCLNEELLKAGLAWHYKQYSSEQSLADMEKEARNKRIGLWSGTDPIPP